MIKVMIGLFLLSSAVAVEGHATNLLRIDSQQDTYAPSPSHASAMHASLTWEQMLGNVQFTAIAEQDAEASDLMGLSNESLAPSTPNMERLLDVSSSCSDMERLDTHYRDDATDVMSEDGCSSMMEDGGAGEAMSPSIEDMAPEVLTPARRRAINNGKPPNVMIYCGKKDSSRQFEAVKQIMQQCLNPDKYVIYHLKHEQVVRDPWMDNAVMLIIASEKAYDGTDKVFFQYFQSGGTVVSFSCPGFDNLFDFKKVPLRSSASVLSMNYGEKYSNVSVIGGRQLYQTLSSSLASVSMSSLAKDVKTELPVILEVCHEETAGVAILSQVLSNMARRYQYFEATQLGFFIVK